MLSHFSFSPKSKKIKNKILEASCCSFISHFLLVCVGRFGRETVEVVLGHVHSHQQRVRHNRRGKHSEKGKGSDLVMWRISYINHVTKTWTHIQEEGTTRTKPHPSPILTVVPQKHSAIDLKQCTYRSSITKFVFSVYTHTVFLPLKWFASHFWEWPVKNYFLFRQQPLPDSSVQICFFFFYFCIFYSPKFC